MGIGGFVRKFTTMGVSVLLALAGMLLTAGSALGAHTSTACQAKNATVTRGGLVTINVTDCTPLGIGFAGIGPVDGPAMPAHGSANLRISGSNWFVDYSHNGDTATSDYFEFTDATGNATAQSIVGVTITITGATSPIAVAPATLPTLVAGTPLSQQLSSSGGVGSYSYALQSGALPIGLTLTSAGLLSGTPTHRGIYSFAVRSTDSTGQFTDKGYSGNVQNPVLTLSPSTYSVVQNTPVSFALTTTGGVAPYSYQTEPTPGQAPAPGLTMSAAGLITGTPTTIGSTVRSIRVTDASTPTNAAYFELESLTVNVVPPPSVSIAATSTGNENGSSSMTFTLTRSAALATPTVVNVTTSGTATPGADFNAVSTVTIPAGASSATLTLPALPDNIVEPDKTLTVTVVAGTAYVVGSPSAATTTLVDDDTAVASVTVSPASVTENGGQNLIFTVSLTNASSTATTIQYTLGGTATSGTDYSITPASSVIIPAGSTSAQISVTPVNDSIVEANETVTLTLSSLLSGSSRITLSPTVATGTIIDTSLPTLSIADASIVEGNSGTTNLSFTVSLSSPAGPGGVSFDIATADGTALAGSDYVARSLTAQTIPAGSSSYSFTVQVNGDPLNEPNETFFVNVTNVTSATVLDGQAVGTIINDDPQPGLSIGDVTIVEGNGGTSNAVFAVNLSAASGFTVTVNYSTADGTATQPADYIAVSGTLTFPPGQTARTISVPVVGDTVPEANQTFFVNLSGPVNATLVDAQGVATIVNDDVPVTIAPATLPNPTVAQAFSQSLTGNGGQSPYSFSHTAGQLPSGLTLSPAGLLSGTPTAGGSFTFTVTAIDSSGAPGPFSGNQTYTVVVNSPTVGLPALSPATAVLGVPYTSSLPASGGTAPYSYQVSSGALPNGLGLNPGSGALTGAATALGMFNFAVTATDSSTGTGPYSATRNYSITVVDQPPTSGNSTLTVPYNAPATSVPLALGGGTATSLTVTIPPTHGTVIVTGPTSLTYQPVPGYAGADSFSYRANNSGGQSTPAIVSVTVSNPVTSITASGPLNAGVAVPYTQTFAFNGGAQPWSAYQVSGLPTGLAISANTANTVTVSGNPTQAGTFSLIVSATDSSTGSGPFTANQGFALQVAAPMLSLSPVAGSSFSPTYNTPFSQSFTAAGGVGPYSYGLQVTTGALPAGLGFDPLTGLLSGTATAAGTVGFTVTAIDSGATGTGAPFTIQRNYSLAVSPPNISVNPTTLPAATVAAGYGQALTASGGIAPYSFAVTAGALPAGLTLDGAGNLAGVPTAGGSFNFTVTATDGGTGGATGSRQYTLVVQAPSLLIAPATLPAGTVGVAYSQTLSGSAGTAPYSFALTSGALPAGLTLSGAGLLAGTPTTGGPTAFTVTMTDSSTGSGPFTAVQTYNVTVNAGVQTVNFAPPPTLPVSTLAVGLTASTSSGLTPITFSTTSPASICTVTGDQLLAVGTGSCDVTASQAGDGNYLPASTTVSVAIVAAVPDAPTLIGARVEQGSVTISFTPPAFTGGSAIIGYTATCTMLGAASGLTATATTSPITLGGLSSGAIYSCAVVATNAVGNSIASAAVLLDVPGIPVPSLNLLALALLALLLAGAGLSTARADNGRRGRARH